MGEPRITRVRPADEPAPLNLTTKERCAGCTMPATPVGLDHLKLCTDCRIDVDFGMRPGATARAEEWIDSNDRADWEDANPGWEATRALVYGDGGGA